jgi:hypothetical protein
MAANTIAMINPVCFDTLLMIFSYKNLFSRLRIRYDQAADAAVYSGSAVGLFPNVEVVSQSATGDEPPQANCRSLGRDVAFGRKRFRADWPIEPQDA